MGGQIGTYFTDGFGRIVAFLPHLVSAILILAIGWGVAAVLRLFTRKLLQRVRFDGFVERRVHHKMTSKGSPTRGVAALVFWVIMLAAFSMASRALGLDALAGGLSRILAYVPHVLVASAIVIAGIAVGRLVAGLVGEVANRAVANVARSAVIVLASFMALDEIGVARGIVLSTFTLIVGAAAVAAAIAFGWGNRELAGEYTRRWVRKAEEEEPEPPTPREPLTPDVHH